jgi:hypothetical protein
MIDEVRISKIPRSAEWILTCYNNQYDPSGFYTILDEEIGQPATVPIVHDPLPYDNETEVSIYLSEISFNLTDYQSDLMSYSVTTTPDIGSGNGNNVGNGKYSVPINHLAYSTTYTWNVNVTDDTHQTCETFTFTTPPRPQYWWNSSWEYRKPITINHNQVAADLSGFPVLIDLVDADLASKAQPEGDDIAFADNYGYKLDHEIEYFSSTTGKLVAWVRIPSLSSTIDTTIYMYYGNPTASNQQNVAAVWDTNFLAVHHLDETSGTCYDSTTNHKDGTPYGSLNQNVTGQIDGADYFDAVNDQIRLVKVFTTETQFTMEAWINAKNVSRYFLSQWNNNNGVFVQVSSTGTSIEWYINAVSAGSATISLNTWYYVVGTYNGTHAMLYLNGGVPATNARTAPSWPSENTYISGRSADLLRQFNGTIDEARFSNISRSSDWIKTCYNNQYNPGGFYTVGGEQAGPPSQTVVFVSPASREAILNNDYVMYVEIAYVENLYAWELQLDYNRTMLDISSVSVVSGGLNEPTNTYHNLTDEITGHLWWAVSTVHPTTTGISYDRHAILEIHFRAIAAGTSDIDLFGTNLSDNSTNPIVHTVVNATITVTGTIDLTVTSISILNHACSIYANDTNADGSLYYYPVEVTIQNTGAVNAGSFYVKLEVYWVNGSITEAAQELFEASLSGGTSVTLNYTSLFHPIHTGIYRLIATVDSRNNVTESNEANNALTQENVPVTVIGDINSDGTTNILDAVAIALAWNATPTDTRWNARANLNHDSVINILDGVRIGLHWGEKQ